jgi:hypothetical protein
VFDLRDAFYGTRSARFQRTTSADWPVSVWLRN